MFAHSQGLLCNHEATQKTSDLRGEKNENLPIWCIETTRSVGP